VPGGGPRQGQRKGEGGQGQAKQAKRRGRRTAQGQPSNASAVFPSGGGRASKQAMRRGQHAMGSSIRDERDYREPSVASMHAPKPGNPSPRITLKKRRTIDVPPEGSDEQG
jgi:hypothetical protein